MNWRVRNLLPSGIKNVHPPASTIHSRPEGQRRTTRCPYYRIPGVNTVAFSIAQKDQGRIIGRLGAGHGIGTDKEPADQLFDIRRI